MNNPMISTPTKPEATETPIQWAVTTEENFKSALVTSLEDGVVFDELKDAFEAARDASSETGEILMVWGLHGQRSVMAIAHHGRLFYEAHGDGDPQHLADVAMSHPYCSPYNPQRSAFPWTINPCEDFSVEPGLTKREWMAAIVASGAVAKDLVPAIDVADECVTLADALLQRLGPTGTDEF
jgi:hypothetical protein